MRAGRLVWCTVVAVYAAIIGLAWQQGYLSQPPERSLRDDYQDVPRAYSDLAPDEFVELFDGLIFTTESGRHLPSLVRWEQSELTFAVAGQTDRNQLVEVRRFVETLSVLMDRSFAEIDRATEADITIQFGSRRRLRQRSGQLLSSERRRWAGAPYRLLGCRQLLEPPDRDRAYVKKTAADREGLGVHTGRPALGHDQGLHRRGALSRRRRAERPALATFGFLRRDTRLGTDRDGSRHHPRPL